MEEVKQKITLANNINSPFVDQRYVAGLVRYPPLGIVLQYFLFGAPRIFTQPIFVLRAV